MVDELGPELEKLLSGLDLDRWREETGRYFDRVREPNTLFNGLFHQWMSTTVAPVLAPDLFRTTVRMLQEWEAANPVAGPRHKGTPYYWLGMAYTLLGDIDQGFLYMHLALEEDRRTSGKRVPNMPAFAFVSLDAQTAEQAFKSAVDAYAFFIELRMATYRADTGGSLTLAAMRRKVIAVESRWDAMFHLVYATARIRRLEQLGTVANSTAFGRNLLGQAVGDLCVVADEWLQQGWPGTGEFFAHALRFLNSRRITKPQAVMDSVAAASKADWGGTVVRLLDGTFLGPVGVLSPIEVDVAIAWLMRNSAVHKVTADVLIAARFSEIESRTYGAIFAIVEAL